MFNLKNSKLGMTLIEMVISLVILSILMTSTMGIIISSSNVFIATSKAAVDRQVGNYIYQTLESCARYSTQMKIADNGTGGTNNFKQAFVLSEIDNDDTDEQTGYLKYKSPTSDDLVLLYDNSFFAGRTIRYKFQKSGLDNKHLKITIEVFREGKRVYSRSGVIKCVNLGLTTTGMYGSTIDDSAVTDYELYNQDVYFTCPDLELGGVDTSWSVEYKVNEFMAKYNAILEDYFDDLTVIMNDVSNNIGKNEENQRVHVSALASLINGRTTAVFGDGKCYGETGVKSIYPDDGVTSANYKESDKVYNLRAHYQERIYDLLKFTPTKTEYAKGTAFTSVNLINNPTDSTKSIKVSDYDGDPYYGVAATKEELYLGFLLNYYDTQKEGQNGYGVITEDEYPHFADASTFFDGTMFNKDDYAEQMVILSYFDDTLNDVYTNALITSGTTEVQFYETKGERLYGTNWSGSFASSWAGSSSFEISNSKSVEDAYIFDSSDVKTGEVSYSKLAFSLTNGNSDLGYDFGSSKEAKHDSTSAWGTAHTPYFDWHKVINYVTYQDGKVKYYNYTTPTVTGNTLNFNIPTDLTVGSMRRYSDAEFNVYKRQRNSANPNQYAEMESSNLSTEITDKIVAGNQTFDSKDVTGYWSFATVAGWDPNTNTFSSSNTNLIGLLGAENIESYATVSGPTQVNVSSGTYSNSNKTNKTTLTVNGTSSVPEGWYYYFDDSDSSGTSIFFFYLKANKVNHGGTETVNKAETAVAAGSKIELYSKGWQLRFVRYQQAEYYLTDDMSSTGVDQYKAGIRMYNLVKKHKYTDYILYSVDWDYWFDSPSKGLINKVVNGAVNAISEATGWIDGTKIESVSPSNANKVLGNSSSLALNTFSLNRSYNNAWLVYNDNRGTWYYLPSDSSRISTYLSGTTWYSSGDTPTALDVKAWGSSTNMKSDIETRQLTSKALFGLVDSTQDVIWIALPSATEMNTPLTTLKSLSISGVTLSPSFSSSTIKYKGTLAADTATSVISAKASDNTATVKITNSYTDSKGQTKTDNISGEGVITWKSGENTVTITIVNSSTGVTQRYFVTVKYTPKAE